AGAREVPACLGRAVGGLAVRKALRGAGSRADLRVEPLSGSRAIELLEPAIGIRDTGPVVVVYDVIARSVGIGTDRTGRRRRNREGHPQNPEKPQSSIFNRDFPWG